MPHERPAPASESHLPSYLYTLPCRSSDLSCCYEGDRNPLTPPLAKAAAYYPGRRVDDAEEYDAILPYSYGFLCNW